MEKLISFISHVTLKHNCFIKVVFSGFHKTQSNLACKDKAITATWSG